jgi:tetratricopeptide (TPR) repeat protein
VEASPRITYRTSPDIQPFWQRVPRFFIFPLQPASIMRILAFSGFAALGALATSVPGMVVAIAGMSLLAWIFFLRFACRVLSETSMGRLSLADYPDEPDDSLSYMPFKLFGLMIIPMIAVGFIIGLFGPTVGILAYALVSFAMPAALMVMVISRSLTTGLNPSAAWSVITAMGKPYLLLWVFLYFLSSAEMMVIAQVVEHMILPLAKRFAELSLSMSQVTSEAEAETVQDAFKLLYSQLRPRLTGTVFLAQAVAMHFTLIAFNMLGYALYQYHGVLGLDVDEDGGRPDTAAKQAEGSQDQAIAALLAEGKLDQALDLAYEAQRLEPDNIAAQERYHKLLHLAGKDERLLNHSNKLIPLLVRREQSTAALQAWKRCQERHPDFRLEDPAALVKLAETARTERDGKLALKLLNGFDRNFRNHPLVPEVYFLCGSVLCEDLRKDELADRFLATLCSRYPQHPRVDDARRLREVIAKMRPQPAEPSGA